MKITAEDLKKFGVIDEIIKEPDETNLLRKYIKESLDELSKLSSNELLEKRYDKFRKIRG